MSSMNQIALLAAIAAGAAGARAGGVSYGLLEDSYCKRDHCVGPCNCMPWSEEGPMTGTFVLTLDHSDPVFDYYTLTDVKWHIEGDLGPIDFSGTGTFRIGGEVALEQEMVLDLVDGLLLPDHAESGLVKVEAAFPEIIITLKSSEMQCTQSTIDLHAKPLEQGCYADCDGSGELDLFDFLCFVNTFNAGDDFADCDGSGGLDLFDFLCFVNLFNDGC